MQAGYGEYQVSQQNGRRADAFATHLKPALGRPNLSVVTGARTTKLATEGGSAGARAVGVEYAVDGRNGARQTGEQAAKRGVAVCWCSEWTPITGLCICCILAFSCYVLLDNCFLLPLSLCLQLNWLQVVRYCCAVVQ